MNKWTIADQLERARLILSAVEVDSELSARLAVVGYNQAAIQAGRALYEASGGAHTVSHAVRGDQLGATQAVKALRQRVKANYSTLAQIARKLFEDNVKALETLGLRTGQRATPTAPPSENGQSAEQPSSPPKRAALSQSQAAFLDRARVLYDATIADQTILAELTQVGYPPERLQSERDQVTALENADVEQERKKAEAKAQTAIQRETLKELNRWVSRFAGIVTPALKDRPDLLNKMGLRARGRRNRG